MPPEINGRRCLDRPEFCGVPEFLLVVFYTAMTVLLKVLGSSSPQCGTFFFWNSGMHRIHFTA